jgi:tRNA nucleotidyltransferase (CCA-adding enzyme)
MRPERESGARDELANLFLRSLRSLRALRSAALAGVLTRATSRRLHLPRDRPASERTRESAVRLRGMFEALPDAVRALLARLAEAGHEAVLVGGCVRDRARGAPVHDWDVATSASPQEVLALFRRAVPIGLRFGTVMVPTPAGPVDVTRYRGPTLADDLAHRDFTVNSVAWDPARRAPVDPNGGLADLAARRLRAVGRAEERLAEDPVRALRAARIAAELGLAVDAALEAALPAAAGPLLGVAAERVSAELLRLLAVPAPLPGLALLRQTGLEAALVPGAREDALRVIAALPADLTLRLAAWLRGANAPALLSRWRIARARRVAVENLLALHPVDETAGPGDAGARRLRTRAGVELERAFALREAECAAGAVPDPGAVRERLAALRARLARTEAQAVARAALALSGDEVMACLGVGPGPRVGAALRHLLERVLEDPAENTKERRRERLREWSAPGSDAR